MSPASQSAGIKQNILRIFNVTGLIANVDRPTHDNNATSCFVFTQPLLSPSTIAISCFAERSVSPPVMMPRVRFADLDEVLAAEEVTEF